MKNKILVTSERVFAGDISPLIYGEFIEFIDSMIPGMRAERLRDRSFAGLTPPANFYRQEKDFPQPAWSVLRIMDGRAGEGQRTDLEVAFDLDPSNPFIGRHSARIQVRRQHRALAGQKGFLGGIVQETDRLRAIVAASCPRLKLGITEWNHTGGDWGEGRA
jgi:hypothetical protein